MRFEIVKRGLLVGRLFACRIMMTALNFHQVEIYDYIKLDLNDRANLLWDEGVFIEKYIDLHIITNLYYLNKFYVEVVLSNKDGRISEITPFRSGERLEKYIRHVDLKSLI